MTTGAWIHDAVSRHVGACVQCQSTDAENVRVAQPERLRRTVPAEVLAKMCPDGRAIYRAYLRWLAEPDE